MVGTDFTIKKTTTTFKICISSLTLFHYYFIFIYTTLETSVSTLYDTIKPSYCIFKYIYDAREIKSNKNENKRGQHML